MRPIQFGQFFYAENLNPAHKKVFKQLWEQDRRKKVFEFIDTYEKRGIHFKFEPAEKASLADVKVTAVDSEQQVLSYLMSEASCTHLTDVEGKTLTSQLTQWIPLIFMQHATSLLSGKKP